MVEAALNSANPGHTSVLLDHLNRMVAPSVPDNQQRASGRAFVSYAIALGLPRETIDYILKDLSHSAVLGRSWFATLDPLGDRGRERLT